MNESVADVSFDFGDIEFTAIGIEADSVVDGLDLRLVCFMGLPSGLIMLMAFRFSLT